MFLYPGLRVCSNRSAFCSHVRRTTAVMEIAEPRVLFSTPATTASQLVIIQQPSDAVAGAKISPIIIDALDSSGNVVIPPPHTKVTLSVTDSSGNPVGQFTAPLAKDGEAIFKNVSIGKVGTYTVQAQDGALTTQVSHSFAIAAAKGSGLIFSQLPLEPLSVGDSFSVQLLVVDRFGNVTSDNKHRIIKLSLASHPRLASLRGVLTETTDNGQIMFGNLSVTLPGNYILKGSMGSAAAKSSPFAVTYISGTGAA